jgi:hypothetical protein
LDADVDEAIAAGMRNNSTGTGNGGTSGNWGSAHGGSGIAETGCASEDGRTRPSKG